MPWARASALQRHLECPAASWLPQLDRGVWRPGYLALGTVELPPAPDELPDTSAADWGTAMHEAKAAPDRATEPFISVMDPIRERFWPSHLGVHEQAVAYDCKTRTVTLGPANRPLAEMDAWKFAQGPDAVVGTGDWWAELPTGEPWYSDLKTGWRRPETLTAANLFYGLCLAKVKGSRTVRLSIDWMPRGSEVPERDGSWFQVGPVTLEAFEEDLNLAWRRATQIPNPAARPGPWCQYCPSATVCDRAFE